MAVEVFGLTFTNLVSDYWPQFKLTGNSSPTATRMTEIIEKVAAEVNGFVVASGGDPAAIDSTDEPISFFWLQETIGYGAAAQMARAMVGANPDGAKEYQRLYEKRIKLLIDKPNVALADHYDDLTNPAGSVRSHVEDLSLSDSEEDDSEYTNVFKMEDDL